MTLRARRALVWAAVILLAALGCAVGAGDEPGIRITSPVNGARFTRGDQVRVEVELGTPLRGAPFSVRLDGESIWVGQQEYGKSFDSADWGEGEHWLQATVFRGDDEEVKSAVVWVDVRARPREARERMPPEEPEPAAPAAQQPSTPVVTDGFNDGSLAGSIFRVADGHATLETVEADNELRVRGITETDKAMPEGLTSVMDLSGSREISIWFRLPELSCPEQGQVVLEIEGQEDVFAVSYWPLVGYRASLVLSPGNVQWVRAFGDESEEWHRLGIEYDAETGIAYGYVDEKRIGSEKVGFDTYKVTLAVFTEVSGCSVDVRFDDFEMRPLGEAFAEVEPIEVPEQEAQWERDAYLGEEAELVRGEVVERHTPFGDYFEYVPVKVHEPVEVVVIAHGSEGDDKMTLELSRVSARWSIHERGWLLLADTKGVIIVAPSFDRERFFGYRYLWGSPLKADDFVFRILEGYRQHFDVADKVLLFGNSAGGQFAQRFVLAHPDRTLAAVISSAGTFAYPDDEVEWPFGRRKSPNPEGFLEATQIPLRVIVGSQDVTDLSDQGRGQRGSTHLQRAQAWVEEMRQLAWDNDMEAKIDYIVIPGAQHSAWALDVSSVWWLADVIEAARAGE